MINIDDSTIVNASAVVNGTDTIIAEIHGVFYTHVYARIGFCEEHLLMSQITPNNFISDSNLYVIEKATNNVGGLRFGIAKYNDKYYIYTNKPGIYYFYVESLISIISPLTSSEFVTDGFEIKVGIRDKTYDIANSIPLGTINATLKEIKINKEDGVSNFESVVTRYHSRGSGVVFKIECNTFDKILFGVRVIDGNTNYIYHEIAAMRYDDTNFAYHELYQGTSLDKSQVYSYNGDLYVKLIGFGELIPYIPMKIEYVSDLPENAFRLIAKTIGSTSQRPTGYIIGNSYLDTTLNEPVWWNGTSFIRMKDEITLDEGDCILKLTVDIWQKIYISVLGVDPQNKPFNAIISGTKYSEGAFAISTMVNSCVPNMIKVYSHSGFLYVKIAPSKVTILPNFPITKEIVTEVPSDAFRIDRQSSGSSTERPGNYFIGNVYYDTDLNRPLFKSRADTWVESDGASAGVKRFGNISQRPSGNDIYIGFMYRDTEINKLIFASEISESSPYTVTWVDSTGTTV